MLANKKKYPAGTDDLANCTADNSDFERRNTGEPLSHALKVVEMGWRVLPLRLNDKRPSLPSWPEKATSDEKKIIDWWELEPDRGYGIVTGKDSCIVLDVDVKNGQPGMQSLQEIFSDEEIADFVTVETPSGGRHFYFHSDCEIRNAQGFMPGLDIRGDGGYIIGPGTRLDSGTYQLTHGSLEKIPNIPQKLVAAISTARKGQRQLVKQVLSMNTCGLINEGSRNTTLFNIACSLRDDFQPQDQVLDRLSQINADQCDPPMDEMDIETIVQSAFSREPNTTAFLDRFARTEKGASEVLLHFQRDRIIYIPEFKAFAFWNGHIWQVDTTLEAERMVKFITDMYGSAKTEMQMLSEAAIERGDKVVAGQLNAKAGAYAKMESKTGSYAGMKNIIDLARSEVVVNQCRLDADDFKFATMNGVIDLRNGDFSPVSNREDYITMRGALEYDPAATCPEWEKFIDEIMLGDRQMVNYLQRVVGYMLTGSTREQALFFLYGFGANGKSTFMNICQKITGDYQVALPASSLMAKSASSGASASPDLAMLRGKRLAVASELEENECFNESLVKSLTGGDVLSVRKLYAEFFQLEPKFKLVLVGNHRPYVRGSDDGIWRRIHLIPFKHQVPKSQQDRQLESRLMAELPGILNWAIKGCLEWQQSSQGLGMPDLVKQETQNYRATEDLLQRFLGDRCAINPSAGEYQKNLYAAYKAWAAENNEFAMSNRKFGEKLREHGFQKVDRSGGNCWIGLALSSGYGADEPVAAWPDFTI